MCVCGFFFPPSSFRFPLLLVSVFMDGGSIFSLFVEQSPTESVCLSGLVGVFYWMMVELRRGEWGVDGGGYGVLWRVVRREGGGKNRGGRRVEATQLSS